MKKCTALLRCTLMALLTLGACLPSPSKRAVVPNIGDLDTLRAAYSGAPKTWPAPVTTQGQVFVEMAPVKPVSLTTEQLKRAYLGEQLFYEPILSKNNDISCATCHQPQHFFADNKRRSKGHGGAEGQRHTPSLMSVSKTQPFFWDGRVATLKQQALHPIVNPIEMAADLPKVEARLNADEDWTKRFKDAGFKGAIKSDALALALADYQRTLYRETVFDKFLKGDKDALDDQELKGLHLFRTKARCMTCHHGPMFTDGKAHNIGLSYYGRNHEDLGIFEQTDQPEDVGKFNTPSLRHVSHTAPYMHVGFFPHLSGVLNVYNAGGFRPKARGANLHDPLFPETTDLLVLLDLSKDERADIEAFLKTL